MFFRLPRTPTWPSCMRDLPVSIWDQGWFACYLHPYSTSIAVKAGLNRWLGREIDQIKQVWVTLCDDNWIGGEIHRVRIPVDFRWRILVYICTISLPKSIGTLKLSEIIQLVGVLSHPCMGRMCHLGAILAAWQNRVGDCQNIELATNDSG